MLQTYQTKINQSNINNLKTKYLDEIATYFGYIERKLFVECFINNRSRSECKNDYLVRYHITARQFNSIYIQLKGKVDSIKELNKVHLADIRERIKSLETCIKFNVEKQRKLQLKILKVEKVKPFSEYFIKVVKQYKSIKFLIHQKKRKFFNCRYKLEKLEQNISSDKIRICFGSNVLFNKQFNLSENNYNSHSDWKSDWNKSRSSQLFCLGSKDESSGNQTCTYTSNHDLRLKVAYNFEKVFGKYIIFKDINYKYGQEVIDNAIQTYMGTTKGGNVAQYVNSAISYRFMKNEFGWYINTTTEKNYTNIITNKTRGSIGIDMNAGFASFCEIDRFGNPINEKKLTINMYNRSSNQVTASIGDVVKYIVDQSTLTQKPIVIESLDFSKKKSALGQESKKYSRMLSGFAYSKFKEMLKARTLKHGAEIIEVNPSYTSIIGQFKFMKRYGLSSHGSAACVIARRGLGFKIEKPKYNSIVGNFEKYINNKPLKSRWSSISYLVTKQYYFKDRIELLKLES